MLIAVLGALPAAAEQAFSGRISAVAQRVRHAVDRAEAASGARELAVLTAPIADDGLARAQSQMNLILKGENLLGAPR